MMGRVCRAMGLFLVLAHVCACASSSQRAPRERYLEALRQRFDGDSRAYYDELIALAHDAPQTRAGRRARATLQSGTGIMTQAALLGTLASVAVPSFLAYRLRARQSEAQTSLRAMAQLITLHELEHGRFCTSVRECQFEVHPDSTYTYVMGDERLGGDPGLDPEWRAAADSLAARTRLGRNEFRIAAIANLDADPVIDIWLIDERGDLEHLVDDTKDSDSP